MVTKPKSTNTRAFTLVELLVVISIIALLLSVLMPSLQKAREQAKTLICSSNMKQYSLAMGMYLIDSGDAFPHPLVCLYTRDSFDPVLHPAGCRWHDAEIEPDGPFWPYMASMKAHVCPTFRSIVRREGNSSWHVTNTLSNHVASIPIVPTISYVMNGYLSAGDEVENLMILRPAYRMAKASDVKRPSDTLFMTEENTWPINTVWGWGDCTGDWSTAGLNDMFFYRADPKTGSLGDCIATYHKASSRDLNSGKGNVVFIDGHVALKRASDSFYLSVGKSPMAR